MTVDGQWDFRPERRSALAERVMAALRVHPRVASVGLFGSLASGEEDSYPADRFSDIDVEVRIEGVSDRDFFLAVPALVGNVGSILMRGASVEPDRYIAHLWFAGYPPFWHVDVACLSSQHVEGDDLVEATRSEREFGLWLLAVKRLLRAMDTIALVREAVDGPADGRGARGAPADQLVELLETWRRRVAAEGKPYEQPYAACIEIAQRLLR